MWSDSESDIDYLNFSEVAESVAEIIKTPELLPISIGVFGDWGAGKSTILQLVKKDLNKQDQQKFIHIDFDAWLFQGYDDARAAILETIATALIKHTKDNESLWEKAKSLGKRVNKIRALGLLTDIGATAFGIPTGGAISKLSVLAEEAITQEDIDKGKLIDEGKNELGRAAKQVKGLLNEKEIITPPKEIIAFRNEYKQLLEEIELPLVVYIDNLDRCTPINAIQTLEAIRLFLFLPNTAFVIAADEDMIRSAVIEYHKGATSRHQTDYLDKLIQVPVHVPKPGLLEVRAYLFMLLASSLNIGEKNLKSLQVNLTNSMRNSWREKPITVEELLSKLTLPSDSKLEEVLKTAERITPLLTGSSRINGNPTSPPS